MILVAATFAALVAPVTAGVAARPCGAARGVIADNGRARLWTAEANADEQGVFGCLRSARRRVLLRTLAFDECLRHAHLGGRFAVVEIAGCTRVYDTEKSDRVLLYDLKARRLVREDDLAPPPDSFTRVSQTAVRATGVAAVISAFHTASETEAPPVDVWIITRSRRRQLDHGSVDPGSLRQRGNLITWTNAGVRKTARFE